MPDTLVLRPEAAQDVPKVEALTREAFWNVYRPGCVEHYLLHRLRQAPCYLPHLHYLAVEGAEVLGSVVCTRSTLTDARGRAHPVITIGPLSVRPARQRQGLGSLLMRVIMDVARRQGEKAAFLYGDPAFYGRLGFRPASAFGITAADGGSIDAFQVIELQQGALSGLGGRHAEDPIFDDLPPEAVDAYDRQFPSMEKKKLPGQLFD